MDRSVITIAVGKQVYVDMALNLARSFLLWNNNDIEFILVTDRLDVVKNAKIYNRITVIEIDTNDYTEGFTIKLYLDRFIKTQKTLFIDCDCLIYADLSQVFEIFKGNSVSTIGQMRLNGEFFGDIKSLITYFNLNYLPVFVGAIYYIEKGDVTNKIFECARQLKDRYDEIGLIRLRGKENEEPLIAIGMANYEQKTIVDNGDIKADCMFYKRFYTNVLKGNAKFMDTQLNPVPLMISHPRIVHFNAFFANGYKYKADEYRLKLYFDLKMPIPIITVLAILLIVYPGIIKIKLKNICRPFFRVVIGYRKVEILQR